MEDEYIQESVRTIGEYAVVRNFHSFAFFLFTDLLVTSLTHFSFTPITCQPANPNNPYYQKLMTALFTQQSDKHKDYTYDYNSGHSDLAAYNEIAYSKVRVHTVNIQYSAVMEQSS